MKRIPLSQGKFALVDDEDFEFLSQWKWGLDRSGSGYASRNAYLGGGRKNPKRQTIRMHRLILGLPGDVDHIDGDGLNNQKSNLRPCGARQNAQNRRVYSNNSSGYKGVCFNTRDNKYQANIRVDGRLKFLGYFKDAAGAATAYNEAANKYFGEFARPNIIKELV